MAAEQALRVVKLGGSLLSFPGLATAFRNWLTVQPAMASLVVTGGGQLADDIRKAQSTHRLDGEAAHWLAIRVMTATAELAAAIFPEAALLAGIAEMSSLSASGRLAILSPWRFLREEEPLLPGTPLPAGWHVTSDSIAARTAAVLQAEELVLLKSSLPAVPLTLAGVAAQGYVDGYFPRAAADVARVRCVDLRNQALREALLDT